MSPKIFSIVVLYNPQMTVLQRLLDSVVEQVAHIVLVDNSTQSDIKTQTKQLLTHYQNSSYLDLGDNLGIATAQNRGMALAFEKGADYVLLMDQDSALPEKMVEKLLKAEQELSAKNIPVAAVGPSFIDEKHGDVAKVIRHKNMKIERIDPEGQTPIESSYIISSGTLIKKEMIEKVGNFNELLFIDWVDIEWCLRAGQKGYKVFMIPIARMQHSIGDDSAFFIRRINLHSDFRNYFIVRNSVYLALYGKMPLNFSLIQTAKVPTYIAFYSFHSKRKLYSLGLLSRAVVDGITKKMGKGHFQDKGL